MCNADHIRNIKCVLDGGLSEKTLTFLYKVSVNPASSVRGYVMGRWFLKRVFQQHSNICYIVQSQDGVCSGRP